MNEILTRHYWHTEYITDDTRLQLNVKHPILQRITADGFNSSNVGFSDLDGVLRQSTHYAELLNDAGRILGFAFFYVTLEDFDGYVYMHINKICIERNAQGAGHAYRAIEGLINKIRPGYIGAVTQTPKVIRLLSRFSNGTVFPISITYRDHSIGYKLISFIQQYVPQVHERVECKFNADTGVYKKLYEEGKLDGTASSISTAEIEERLRKLNVNADNGDAVLCIAAIY